MKHSSKFQTSDSALINDELILDYPSKSAAKREANKLKLLAEELVNLPKNVLAKLPLEDDLRADITLAQTIQKEAKRRQIQYIGKYLRTIEITPITTALALLKNKHSTQSILIKKIQEWQQKLMEGDDATVEQFLKQYPMAERQQLKTLLRKAKKQITPVYESTHYRALYNYLKGLCDIL